MNRATLAIAMMTAIERRRAFALCRSAVSDEELCAFLFFVAALDRWSRVRVNAGEWS